LAALAFSFTSSHISHHILHIIRHHTSHITHHTSHITHHTSHITHHTSHITHHTSHPRAVANLSSLQADLQILSNIDGLASTTESLQKRLQQLQVSRTTAAAAAAAAPEHSRHQNQSHPPRLIIIIIITISVIIITYTPPSPSHQFSNPISYPFPTQQRIETAVTQPLCPPPPPQQVITHQHHSAEAKQSKWLVIGIPTIPRFGIVS
jgi:hypothetical protein